MGDQYQSSQLSIVISGETACRDHNCSLAVQTSLLTVFNAWRSIRSNMTFFLVTPDGDQDFREVELFPGFSSVPV